MGLWEHLIKFKQQQQTQHKTTSSTQLHKKSNDVERSDPLAATRHANSASELEIRRSLFLTPDRPPPPATVGDAATATADVALEELPMPPPQSR
mmetsp:Transcript_6308/g.9631  ORF Transcript_6308/g.9631 Transcript_6308/m.9631 type:complete len:94 (-) Transcript_6308:794-1075(-)